MGALDFIPRVNNFCFYMTLKQGTMFIAIIGILSLEYVAYAYHNTSAPNRFIRAILAMHILIFITGALLVYGVLTDTHKVATWFVSVVIISLALYLLCFLYTMFTIFTIYLSKVKVCSFPYMTNFACLVHVFVWFYFAAVVNSYRKQREYDISQEIQPPPRKDFYM